MTIEAKIIADSIGYKTRRLTTFELKYPRFIHAEFMTHRQFSRNASSSRAIPVARQIEAIIEDTAMPIHWGKNQPGMQAHEEQDALVYGPCGSLDMVMNEVDGATREDAWCFARDKAIEVAQAFHEAGYHKQIVNRILEPFSHIRVVCTSTQYDNFFGLRSHPDAQPEIKALSDAMMYEYERSEPKPLKPGEWHLPYVTDEELSYVTSAENVQYDPVPLTMDDLIKVSVARCARVSYKTHDGGSPSLEADMALYERLVGSEPLHASPAEHQATPDSLRWNSVELAEWEKPHLNGNLSGGWIQYRKLLSGECIDHFVDELNDW